MEELRDPLLIKPWLAGTKCAVAAGVCPLPVFAVEPDAVSSLQLEVRSVHTVQCTQLSGTAAVCGSRQGKVKLF